MANIILTEEEYSAIKALHDNALQQASTASPRLSSHYQKLVALHAKFLAKEDGKRASRQLAQQSRTQIEKLRQDRRAAQLQAAQQRINQASQPAQQATTSGKK